MANAFVTSDVRHSFTGHEDLGEVGLIHMNGRLYDAATGRFLSADPTIQYADDMQNYNRYSYINNNPLSATDPSGYGFFSGLKKIFKKFGKAIKSILRNKILRLAATVAAAYYGGVFAGDLFASSAAFSGLSGTAYNVGLAIATGAGAGFAGGFVASGGNIKAALTGAVAGAVTGSVAGYYGADYNISRVFTNSVANGVSAKIQGRDFMEGLRAGLVTSFAGYGLARATEFTDNLKKLACRTGNDCMYNRWGELLTDGARDVDYKTYNPLEKGNWFTKTGMAFEGSGLHYYDENGLVGRFVNFVSKVHDFQNSWSYNFNTGYYVSRGVAFDTLFQAYSFAGMLPAATFTGVELLADKPYITNRIK